MSREYVLTPQNQEWFTNMIRGLIITDDKKTHKQVQISTYSNSRSVQMNRYFHVLRDLAADEWGWDKDDMSDFLKKKFLGTHIVERNGELLEIINRSSKLDVMAFGKFIDQVQAFLLGEGMAIPAPPYQQREIR